MPGGVPDDLKRAERWADEAILNGDWEDAVRRWEAVLDRFGASVPPKGYVRLAAAYREMGVFDRAGVVINRGRAQYPEDVRLAVEWAQQAMIEESWANAVNRWRDVATEFEDQLSPRAFTRMAASLWEHGDTSSAQEVLARAGERFPSEGLIARSQAQLALVEEDWPEAFRRWDDVLDRYPSAVESKDLARLVVALRRQAEHSRAAQVIAWGLERFPNDLRVVAEAAHLAMAREDWATAVDSWRRVSDLSSERHDSEVSFPGQSSLGDWFATAWQQIGASWEDIAGKLEHPPDARLYQAIARTMVRAGLLIDAERMLERGMAALPDDAPLAFEYASARLLRAGSSADTLVEIASKVSNVPKLRQICEGLAALAHHGRSAREGPLDASLVDTARRLDGFGDRSSHAGLPAFHLIRVPRWTSLDLQIRAGRFLTDHTIRERILEVSERDHWEEMFAEENQVLRRARERADRFARQYQRPPHLPAETLSDAVLFFMYHEHCLAEPVRRIAADIASEADTRPVFIEVSGLSFRYLDGYTFSRFDLIYLYVALRRLAVNAFLVLFETEPAEDDDTTAPRLRFSAGARAMVPRGHIDEHDWLDHSEAIVPAGLRSIRRVIASVGEDPLMYSSGSIVKEFAYDRSIQQEYPVEPGATVHPPRDRLPTFSFELWPATTVEGVRLDTRDHVPARSQVEVSEVVGGDWYEWLDAALGAYLEEMSIRCTAEIAVRQIDTLHVCDHIFAESAIFGDAVRRNGGRVVLWPHSANPVHVTVRRPESFDEVHAVTRSGVDQWRRHFPDKKVFHSPSLMLDPPSRDVVIDDDSPLNVVVIGGRSSLGNLPILDRAAHEASYRDFFAGLERLQQDRDVNLRFKPRGVTGEHEMWLFETVGLAAGWRPVLEHPMRLRLPNLLFVSISMGSSALLEGLSRGVPGLIVRDFPVRDYTTIDDQAFPVVRNAEALSIIEGCTHSEGLVELLERELRYYLAELHG